MRLLTTALAAFLLAAHPSGSEPMVLGVQTHLSQGWPLAVLDEAAAVRAPALRDGLPWSAGEPVPGRYVVRNVAARHLMACGRGMDLVLTIVPTHPRYEGGGAVRTEAGQQAYADYLAAVLDVLGDCVVGIEVGNEINAEGALPGVDAEDLPAVYTGLLATVRRTVKSRHPGVAILGGSTNVVGTGFLERLFEAGALAEMDAVAVHPYRSNAEGIGGEIERLRDAMDRHGGRKPIWATEFGDDFETAEAAAPHLLKMVALLGASRIERAYWYALRDQRWFPTMGLLTDRGGEKPAARAFRLAQDLVRRGEAVDESPDDRSAVLVRFGSDAFVAWGGGNPLAVADGATVLDAEGRPVAAPARLADDPVVVIGARPDIGAAPVVGDSLMQYPDPPWSYVAVTPDGAEHDLRMIDWTWTSFLGERGFNPLRINADTLATAGDKDTAVRPLLRYTEPAGGRRFVTACLRKERKGDGVDVEIRVNGSTVHRAVVEERMEFASAGFELSAGDTVDVLVGPNLAAGGDATGYRVRVHDGPASDPPCR